MTNRPDCCLIASDLHCLSTFALLRPGFTTTEGNEIGLNDFQRWLWEQFVSCLAEVNELARGRKYVLILNGDLIEGNHHRTTEILAVDESEHARAAVYTLQPLLENSSHTFVVEGTECHTGMFEHAIAKEIGATPTPSGRYAWPILNLSIHGCLGSIRHHMPTTSRAYLEASQLSIQPGNAQLSAVRDGHEPPKWFAGAHRHRQGIYTDGNVLFAVTPAWQGVTRYGRKVVPDGNCQPGFVWLDWAGRPEGRLPHAEIIHRLPPPRERVTL